MLFGFNLAVLHSVHDIALFDCLQPVRDNDQRLSAVQAVDAVHNGLLGIVVERARRFIEHQYFRIFIQCSRDADSLPLAARKADAALADLRVQAIRQGAHMLVQLRFMQRFPYLFIVDVFFRNAESDVFADRSIEHENRLRDIADVAKPSLIVRLYVDAVREHLPALGMKEAEHNVDDRCFAGAGRSDDTDRLSDPERHIRVPEHIGIAARITVGDILQLNFPVYRELRHVFSDRIVLHIIGSAALMNFGLQIFADIVQKRREVSHARQVVVDSVGGRQEPCGRCRENAKL